jgi:hypothetical protein
VSQYPILLVACQSYHPHAQSKDQYLSNDETLNMTDVEAGDGNRHFEFTETTTQSYDSKMKDAFSGVLIVVWKRGTAHL